MVTPLIFAQLIQTYIPTLPHKVESLAALTSAALTPLSTFFGERHDFTEIVEVGLEPQP